MAHIIELITSIQMGGAENIAFALAEHCAHSGLKITVVELYQTSGSYANSKRHELVERGIHTITLSSMSKRWALVEAPFKLAMLLGREKPEMIHSHTDLPDFVLSLALRYMRLQQRPKPLIVRTIHNVQLWSTHPLIGNFTEVGLNDKGIVGVSNAALDAYRILRTRSRLSLAPDCRVIYNGCESLSPQIPPFPLEEGMIHIAYCGRLDFQKGVDVLIQRIRSVEDRWPNRVAFHLIGDGPLRPRLELQVGSCPNTRFHGPIFDASAYFHAFDGVIMPSRFEGFGLVSVEASMSGVPVLASRSAGLDETLPKDWPLFFNLNDEQSFLSVMDSIIGGTVSLKELGEEARRFVTKFSFKSMIEGYSTFYQNNLKGPPKFFADLGIEKA